MVRTEESSGYWVLVTENGIFLMGFITQQLKEGPEEQLWTAKQDKPLCPELWHLGTAAVVQSCF